jgi:DNA-binding transcriptional LysR family regulator
MHNWDDLRVFLAVARHHSYQSAADALGLDPTTVARRIDRLETTLKCTLLARGPGGQTLTATGKRLLESASQVEMANEALVEAVGTTETAGRVRLSTSEGFGGTILSPAVPALMTAKPAVEIEIVANPGFLSPAIREVDIAITLGAPQDKRLVVERLTDYRLGLYASDSYLAIKGTPTRPRDLTCHRLVGYIDDLLYANELRYLDEIHPDLKPSVSSSSIRAQMEIVRAGGGIAVLPCFMATTIAPKLTRILPKTGITRTFWISARRDVQQTQRVRRVRDWVRETVSERQTLLLPD